MRFFLTIVLFALSCESAHAVQPYNVIKNWYLKIPSPQDLSVVNSNCDQEVFSMVEFQNNLYIGMYAAQNGCQSSSIYQWDGTSLSKFKSFVSGNHFQQTVLAVYQGKLYAGVGGDNIGDGDVYAYDPQTTVWSKAFEDTTHHRVHSMASYNGKLYAGFGYLNGQGDVYEFNGSNWTMVLDGGADQSVVESMTVHNGKLMIGGGKGTAGDWAFIYQFDGTTWSPIYSPGGTGNNSVLGLTSFNGKLFASFQSMTNNAADDVKMWDGTTWSTVYDDNNVQIVHGPVSYNGRLYLGTTRELGNGQVLVYDGVNTTSGWQQVFQAPSGEQEAFVLQVYNGELLAGYGFDYLEANTYGYYEVIGNLPAARAGNDMEIAANKEVILDGSASADTDGSITDYLWKRLPDQQILCSGPLPTCKTRSLGRAEEVIELTVTDNSNNKSKDTMSIYHEKAASVCGNSNTDPDEACDGNTISCLTADNYFGTQSCNETCTGFGACSSTLFCGDGFKNGPETCDQSTQSCVTGNGYAGTQTCNAQCTGYDTCTSSLSCGDGVCSPPESSANCSSDCVALLNVTLEAETMTTKTNGGSWGNAWNLWGNGYVESTVNFPSTALYRFEITAKGTVAGGVWPNMQLRIDQVAKASFTVNSTGYLKYAATMEIPAGSHRVAVAFTNDAYISPEDRNLIVDKTTIVQQ